MVAATIGSASPGANAPPYPFSLGAGRKFLSDTIDLEEQERPESLGGDPGRSGLGGRWLLDDLLLQQRQHRLGPRVRLCKHRYAGLGQNLGLRQSREFRGKVGIPND